jgi:hypothetical protein
LLAGFCVNIPVMRIRSTPFLAFICLCLLALQVSGMHLHATLEGANEVHGELHGTHVHPADPDGHDHENDVDISYMEYAPGWAKPLPFLLLAIPLLVFFAAGSRRTWIPVQAQFHSGNYLHWRPPLRAPPFPVS